MKNALWMLVVGWVGMQWAMAEPTWGTDLAAAQSKAKTEKKLVLINFTGSDWCGWCKKLSKEVFTKEEFAQYAAKNLILVEADFPRQKKQSAELKKANQELKAKYSVRGFPTLVLLSGEGRELWKQPGYLAGGPEAFIGKVEQAKKK